MKKINIKTIATIIALVAMTTFNSVAQELTQNDNKNEYSIEIDPATFAFDGYGIHFRFKPKNIDNFLLGIGTYAMDMPDILVDLNENNKNLGWNVRLNQGYGVFGEYHFDKVNNSWFVGTQVSLQEYKIDIENTEGSEKYSNLLLMGYGGFTWKPFDSNFYIKPWAGIGYTSKVSGENIIGILEYDVAPVTMFMTLHIGYTF